jgi:universal stress protein A
MVNIRRVLVPVDFSPCSDAAVRYGLNLAEKCDASVEFVHVFEMPPHYAGEAMVQLEDQPTQTMHDYLRDRAQYMLDELVTSAGETNVPHSQHLTGGTAHEKIAARAKDTDADLIVMGTHGHAGSLKHRLIGSVVDKVLRQAPCPVLVVHAGDQE